MPEHHRNRKRVQLTLDPDIWDRCQEVSRLTGPGFSWSQVAEFAFSTLLDQLDIVRKEVLANLRPDSTEREVHDAMQAYMARQFHLMMNDAYTQLEDHIQNPEKVQEMPKAKKRAS